MLQVIVKTGSVHKKDNPHGSIAAAIQMLEIVDLLYSGRTSTQHALYSGSFYHLTSKLAFESLGSRSSRHLRAKKVESLTWSSNIPLRTNARSVPDGDIRWGKAKGMGKKSEVSSQRSEVSGQKSEAREQLAGGGWQQAEIRGQRSDVRGQR